MVILPVVSEILGGMVPPPPDASKLSKRADAINLEGIGNGVANLSHFDKRNLPISQC